MKPILVQQKSNNTLWWVVDTWLVARPHTIRCYKLIPADDRNGQGSRIDYDTYYTFISN
jgi:hypothetical protein